MTVLHWPDMDAPEVTACGVPGPVADDPGAVTCDACVESCAAR